MKWALDVLGFGILCGCLGHAAARGSWSWVLLFLGGSFLWWLSLLKGGKRDG